MHVALLNTTHCNSALNMVEDSVSSRTINTDAYRIWMKNLVCYVEGVLLQKKNENGKNIFRQSCSNEFRYLDYLMRSQLVNLSAGCLQKSGRKAFLCIKCQQDLSNCEKGQKQFNHLSAEIL